jgi:hypothetical protein
MTAREKLFLPEKICENLWLPSETSTRVTYAPKFTPAFFGTSR